MEPDRDDLIDALSDVAADPTAVVPPILVSLLRNRYKLATSANEVAKSIAADWMLPANLFAPLVRLAELFAPVVEEWHDPQSARLDDIEIERVEAGWNADGLQEFVNRSAHDVLSFDQEQALGRTISEGRVAQAFLSHDQNLANDSRRAFLRTVAKGKSAEDELVRHNMRLVMSIAFRHQARCTAALAIEDLIDEGYFGLAKAVEKWDYTRGLKFSTYATWWIRQTIERAIANKSQAIRIPVHMQEWIRAVWRAENQLRSEGALISDVAIASKTGFTTQRIADLRQYQRKILSLDAPGRGDTAPIALRLPDPREEAESEVLLKEIEDDRVIEGLLQDLSSREAEVIALRFGLDGTGPRTLESVGNELGVTRERIRQIEAKVIKKLRSRVASGLYGTDLQLEAKEVAEARRRRAEKR